MDNDDWPPEPETPLYHGGVNAAVFIWAMLRLALAGLVAGL